jgi:hypothetical protein
VIGSAVAEALRPANAVRAFRPCVSRSTISCTEPSALL